MNQCNLLSNTHPKVAICVPVYNVALYIKECLDSIINQTYSNFIIIAVDDGSTDESGQILDDYATEDERLIVLHQNNSGLSAARNRALETAEQIIDIEFIAFVDSDDRISQNYLEKLVLEANRSKADIVICGMNRFNDSGIWKSREKPYPKNSLSREEFISLVFSIGKGEKKSAQAASW